MARFSVNLHFDWPRTYLISPSPNSFHRHWLQAWGIARRQKSSSEGGGREKEREAKLSIIAYLNNQSVIPESGITRRRHSKNVHSLFSFFPAHIPRSARTASQFFFSPYTPLGSLFTGFFVRSFCSSDNAKYKTNRQRKHQTLLNNKTKRQRKLQPLLNNKTNRQRKLQTL